jgi:hypothetical protein
MCIRDRLYCWEKISFFIWSVKKTCTEKASEDSNTAVSSDTATVILVLRLTDVTALSLAYGSSAAGCGSGWLHGP